MTTWSAFAAQAPTVAEVFTRRHRATGNLCMLATVRADGSPRISPVEPRLFEDMLVIVGMPGTTKFRDLARDPRFCLHTATVDTMAGEGDAKLFGRVVDLPDPEVHRRFAQAIFDESGFDIREEKFDHFYIADLTGGASLAVVDDHLEITVWTPGEGERVEQRR